MKITKKVLKSLLSYKLPLFFTHWNSFIVVYDSFTFHWIYKFVEYLEETANNVIIRYANIPSAMGNDTFNYGMSIKVYTY